MTIKITNDELRKLADRFGWRVFEHTKSGPYIISENGDPIPLCYLDDRIGFGHFLAAMITLGKHPWVVPTWTARNVEMDIGWAIDPDNVFTLTDYYSPEEIMPALVRAAIDMFESEGWR